MKKYSIIGLLIFIFFIFQSSVNKPFYHRFPPTNCTGAPNGYTCGFCHSDFAENMTGGGISIAGIPTTFVKGNTYPFSINIHHFEKDRKKFGYDIVAVDALGNKVGSFVSSNPYSIVGDSEITSNNPPLLQATDNNTITGFSWTAPDSTFSPNRLPIKFYFCGNACNSDGKPNGDYVYNDSLTTTIGILPVLIERFVAIRKSNYEIQLSWTLLNESILKNFTIQKSVNGGLFLDLDSVGTKDISTAPNKYSFLDSNVANNAIISYRIKISGKDKSVSYSSAQTVQPIIRFLESKLYPNPVSINHNLSFEFTSSQNFYGNLVVINNYGKLVFTKKLQIVSGFNSTNLPINQNFTKGTYYLIISNSNNTIQKQKFMVI